MNINKLIEVHKYGTNYQGDVIRDTVDALETIVDICPYEDELLHIIDALRGHDDIEKVLEMLELKNMELNQRAEYVRSLIE
jgi:hypothetical protein